MNEGSTGSADLRQAFERERACYEQNSEHLRSLNQIMWQLPLITMTITGASWYAVASKPELEPGLRSLFLVLVATVEIALSFIILRVRQVMQAHMVRIEQFRPESYPRTVGANKLIFWHRNGFVARCYAFLMLLTATASLAWAWHISRSMLRSLLCS